MNVTVSITPDGVRAWPLHTHSHWEVMYYTEGTGVLRTDGAPIPFAPHTVIAVPPGCRHGSSAGQPFRNISIGADFGRIFGGDAPVTVQDAPPYDGQALARLVYQNAAAPSAYVHSLLDAYAYYIAQRVQYRDPLCQAVEQIRAALACRFAEPDCRALPLLTASGYAVDYIRAAFRCQVGQTPDQYLTGLRMAQAARLIEIYRGTLPVAELARCCGYDDPAYFSRRFKSAFGCAPQSYAARYA